MKKSSTNEAAEVGVLAQLMLPLVPWQGECHPGIHTVAYM